MQNYNNNRKWYNDLLLAVLYITIESIRYIGNKCCDIVQSSRESLNRVSFSFVFKSIQCLTSVIGIYYLVYPPSRINDCTCGSFKPGPSI